MHIPMSVHKSIRMSTHVFIHMLIHTGLRKVVIVDYKHVYT